MASDIEVLQFIHDRMINVHEENENYDYMHALRRVIDNYINMEDYIQELHSHMRDIRNITQQAVG